MKNNRILHSILSSALSIVPMMVAVILLSVLPLNHGASIVSLKSIDYIALLIGAIILIIGLAFFQFGATKGLTQVGNYMGTSLSKQEHLFVVIIFSFVLGALITCAEPSILIVSSQVNINSFLLIGMIALGVGTFVVIGVIRIIVHGMLKVWYLLFYFIAFLLICLIAVDDKLRLFLPFIFDSGGITTGSATVPFILALGAGIATVRGRNVNEDSFGVVGMASIGPILTMTLLLLFSRGGFEKYSVGLFNSFDDINHIFTNIVRALLPTSEVHLGTLIEVAMAILPILIIFFIYNFIFIKLPKSKIISILVGFVISYIGLVIFLTGISAIMTPFGTLVGVGLGSLDSNALIIIICFIIGLLTILCEPAVHVLTTQIHEVSDGQIKKRTVLLALSIGVGIAIGLSSIRTLFRFNILWIVVPGYMLSIVLMFAIPNLYTAMAFDAGGTASGPMSVSFVLPMIIGISYSKFHYEAESVVYYTESFGVVSLIALTPILTIQLLGLYQEFVKIHQFNVEKRLVFDPKDNQIIHFKIGK